MVEETEPGRTSERPEPAYPVIAIDGGAGTGKTTGAALVAERLGFCYVDSGAVYRAVALAARETGLIRDEDQGGASLTTAQAELLNALPLRIRPDLERFRVFLGERELDTELRSPEITSLSSKLAVLPSVRRRVTLLLREAGSLGPMVVEGRDIGTVVFPNAALKVFLQADLEVRARRRRLDLLRGGRNISEEEVARDLAERDERDSNRADAPLRQADGAVLIDTSRLTLEEQAASILDAFRRTSGTPDSNGDVQSSASS